MHTVCILYALRTLCIPASVHTLVDCTDEHTASSAHLILAIPLPTHPGSLHVLALVCKCIQQVWY